MMVRGEATTTQEDIMTESTRGPWTIVDHTTSGKTGNAGYIQIRGPNDEAICTIFPGAGKGGVGIEVARLNAARLVELVNDGEPRTS
jgi:hypothetical protein